MSSPCTRLVRCRVRDLASCFYACRLPLEEDQPDISCSKSSEMSRGSIVFDFEGAGRVDKASGKMPIAKKMGGESSVQSSSSYNINRIDGELEAEPRFAEEEYIVFCFREDGAIDMITEGKSTEDYDEHDNITTTTAAAVVTLPKGDEEVSKKTDTERCRPVDEIKEIISPVSVEGPNPSNMDSWESSDSNLSDTTSTSSFAFPVLGIEWIGSPVHMPNSGNQSVRLHCCRF